MDTEEIRTILRQNWLDLMRSLSVEDNVSEELFELLSDHYEDGSRCYHDFRHIYSVLSAIERQKDKAVDFPAIQLAAWFHDVIYDKHATGISEEKSALLAEQMLAKAGLPSEQIDRVASMIRATEINQPSPDDPDTMILLDADLATLGSESEVYDLNAVRIRREYAHVPETEYRHGRKRVLHKFLKRERIFHTDKMYQLYESRARENIQREIALLA